jgi:hypothetical protein
VRTLARQITDLTNELAKAKRQIGQLEQERSHVLPVPIVHLPGLHEMGIQADLESPNELFTELFQLQTTPPTHRRYSSSLFAYAKSIHDISLSCCALVRNRLHGLPHPNYLHSRASLFSYCQPNSYLELAHLSGILQGWQQAHELASDVAVGGIVAVDAISFREQFSLSGWANPRS